MTNRVSYHDFFDRVRASLLLEQGLKFGVECHGINLRSTISTKVNRMMRRHLNKADVPQTKEEVFFALVILPFPHSMQTRFSRSIKTCRTTRTLTRSVPLLSSHCLVGGRLMKGRF